MKSRISKFLLIIGTAALCGLFSGCAVVDPDTSLWAPHKWKQIYRNRENFAKLRINMTKQEVQEIMGDPIKGESFCEENVWWYYTRTCWTDYLITRDECTPVVFNKQGKVDGWGTAYYRKHYDYVSWNDTTIKRALE